MAKKKIVKKKTRRAQPLKGGRGPSGKTKESKVQKLIRLASARIKKATKGLRRK